MARILCLETATTNCSVTLSENGSVIVLKEDRSKGYSHAERLHVLISEALKEASWEMNDLEAVAISKGPGSYTGLRIGVSAAKGLCYALDIPLISVETLRLLAHQVPNNFGEKYTVPMIDARRMEVYTGTFTESKELLNGYSALILQEDSYAPFLNEGKVVFIGNGVGKFSEICQHPNAIFLKDRLPSSKEMAALSEAKYKIGDMEDVAYFEPYYLKDFIMG